MTPTIYPDEPLPLPYPPQRRSIFHAIAIALVMASALPQKPRDREPAHLPAGLAEFIDQTMVL